jgi:type IV pilus assembly protein PilC
MGISDALKYYWYIFIIVIGGTIFTSKKWFKTKTGKRFKDSAILKIPIVGKNVRKILTSRYTRTMSTLLNSGVPILRAIELATKIADNTILDEKMEYVQINIQKGNSFGLLLAQIDFFPNMMVSMVETGEESGSLPIMLEKTAIYYDKELKKSLDALVSLIEPLAILFMGITIGAIVIAMMLPMFEMFKTIG